MKKIFVSSLLLAATMIVNAIPARPGWSTVTQPDGSTIELQTIGDEYYHITVTRDGQQVRQNEEGFFEVVGQAPSAEELSTLRRAAKARRNAPGISRAPYIGVSPYLPPKAVVIMVNFKDVKFKDTTTKDIIDEICNSENCTVNSYGGVNYGSLAQYFRDQSDGQYNIQFDIYGPVEVSQNYAYYGADYGGEGNDKYAGNLVIEACSKANAEIDFSKYDWNNDGEVDIVYIVYAGKGQADDPSHEANLLWPHSYNIAGARYFGTCTYTKEQTKFDTKYVNEYAMSNELSGNSLAGIGIITHEFGHVIGLPDFYDTTSGGSNSANMLTPNDWDVMDAGGYNGDVHCPPNYNAWEKYFFGWLTPKNLGSTPAELTLVPNGTEGYNSYQINTSGQQKAATASGTNYYIENRAKQGWDTYLPASGMLIWMCNYQQYVWSSGQPNSSSYGSPHFTIVSASGTKIGYTYGTKNVFPYNDINSWSGISTRPLKEITRDGNLIHLFYIDDPAPQTYSVKWVVTGKEIQEDTYAIDGSENLRLPTVSFSSPCEGAEFVGWTKESVWYDPFVVPADLFTTASGKVTADAVYYALFQ